MVDVPSADLLLSSDAPGVAYDRFASPPQANLTLDTSQVGLNTELIVIPSANLTLTVAQIPAPGSAQLTFTTSAPTLAFTASASLEVPSADLRLSVSTPTVRRVVPWASPNDNPNLLCPTDITVKLSAETQSGGRSLTGKKQSVQADAGFWIITLARIRIRSNNDIRQWRKIEGGLNGRANAALIPIPSEDSTIVATVDADVAMGATTLFMDVSAGNDPEEGMHFSVGQRLYRILSVVAQVGSVFELVVLPPVREPITAGVTAEFAEPVCRCRLMRDDGMNITHELLKYSTPTVVFCEDWVT